MLFRQKHHRMQKKLKKICIGLKFLKLEKNKMFLFIVVAYLDGFLHIYQIL